MTGYNKIIRQMRVYEFEVETPKGGLISIIAIDRMDGLRERLEIAFDAKPVRECRPRNVGLMIERSKHRYVVTGAEKAGYASTELMRILNQTSFQGELLFLTNGNTYPLHLLRRLNKIALDFDLGTISMATLLNRITSTTQTIARAHPNELKSAVG